MLISENSGLHPLPDSGSLGRRTVMEVLNRTWVAYKKALNLMQSSVQEGTCPREDFEKDFPPIHGAGIGEGEAGSYSARNRHHV